MKHKKMNNKHIEYQMVFPCKHLKKYIEYYWIMKDIDREHTIKLMPDVRTSMFFIKKATAKYNTTSTTTLNCGFVGAHRDYTTLKINGEMEMIGIQFNMVGAYALFGDISSDCASKIVCSDKFPVVKMLMELINDEPNINDVAKIFNEFFLELQLQNINHNLDVLTQFNNAAYTQTSCIKNVDMKWQTYVGIRQQERWFNKYIGFSPNKFKIIQRFRAALYELIKCNHAGHLEELANNIGYNDLSHMTKDFLNLCGMTPGKFSEYLRNSHIDLSQKLIYQFHSDGCCSICSF